MRARNFWRHGQDAFFDVRVTHVNAKSQSNKSTAAIFKKHEAEKKRQYNERVMDVEHGTFTPLIIGRGVPAVRPATCGETSPEAAGELRTYGGLDTDQALF